MMRFAQLVFVLAFQIELMIVNLEIVIIHLPREDSPDKLLHHSMFTFNNYLLY